MTHGPQFMRGWTYLLVSAPLLMATGPVQKPPHDATSRWIAILRDPAKRFAEAYAFDEIVKQGKAAVPALLVALSDRDPFVRSAVAASLGELEVAREQVVPALIEALWDFGGAKDGDAGGAVGDPVDIDSGQGSDAGTRVSDQAMVALTKIGAPAVPALIEILKSECDPFPNIMPTDDFMLQPCFRAAVALGDISAPAIAPLVKTLRLDPDDGYESSNNYWTALFALRRIGHPAVPLLVRALTAPDRSLRLRAAIALARIRSDLKSAERPTFEIDAVAGTAAVRLASAASHGNYEAVQALGMIGPRGVAPLLAVVRRPDQGSWDRRFEQSLQDTAFDALGRLGREAATAVPALLALRDRGLRDSGIPTLGAIGTSAAIRSLIALVQGSNRDDALAAIDGLALLGPRGAAALAGALEKRELASQAALALAKLGPAAASAVPALVRSLQRPIDPAESEDHRVAAVKALAAVGPPARAAFPSLAAVLADRKLGPLALDALSAIGPQPEVVHAVIQVVGVGDNELVRSACSVLGKFGAAAREAAPSLERLQERGGEVGLAAALALAKIEPGLVALAVLDEHLDSDDQTAVIDAFVHLGARGLPVLAAALNGTAARRLPAAQALARMGASAAAARSALEAALEDRDPSVRQEAAKALVAIGAEVRGALATAVIDSAIQEHLSEAEDDAAEYPPLWSGKSGSHFGEGRVTVGPAEAATQYPQFPWWPPPRFSGHDVLPPSFLGSKQATLAEVYARLRSALKAPGFEENGVFEVPAGFALVTEVERIREDGSAAPRERWSGGKAKPLDLFDYLGRLFLQRPGQFRLIAFVVTTVEDLAGGAALSEGEARVLVLAGARSLPARIGSLPLAGRNCHVLIYHFERQHGVGVTLYPSPLPAPVHLRKAGLWQQLARQRTAQP